MVWDRKAQLKQEGEKLISANSVVIIGGGIVGCELAGDLASERRQRKKYSHDNKQNSDINVTLIHSGSSLASKELGPRASQMVLGNLHDSGVRVIFNEKATIVEKQAQPDKNTLAVRKVCCSSGLTLEANEVLVTTGQTPINDFLDPTWSSVDEKGWIQVDDYFRIKGAGGHIFCRRRLLYIAS
ncbi:hypothetical protein ACA910_000856 [Epithemia clementina (nom. ined.)]